MAGRTARKVYQLEHLYHGSFVEAGRPIGTPQLIAYSPGVEVGQWKECRSLAPVTPAGDLEVSGADSDAVGLFRGKSVDSIIAHAQRNWAEDGVSNPTTVHYLLAPASVAEVLVDNLKGLSQRLDKKMPTFPTLDSSLRSFTLIAPDPLKPRQRVAALTTLLSTCANDARTVRGLLAAVALECPLAIVNCPAPLDARLDFIQGLLALLPPPARARVSFVTNVEPSAHCPALIRFLAQARPSADDQVFDWAEARLLTEPLKSPYSAFAIGQMQLDPVALLRQLDGLADATQHHLASRPLSEALAEVSRRAVMDIALAEGQPIDRQAVSDLLKADPTLKGQLRADYASYLLRLTLSLDEPETADALIPLLDADRSLAVALFRQLDLAAQDGQAQAAYNILRRWLTERPIMAEALPRALGRVALAYARELAKTESPQAVAVLFEELARLPVVLDPKPVRQMTQGALPLARQDQRLAAATLCLAAQYLEAGDFDSLLTDPVFVGQLPRPVQNALFHLKPEKPLERPTQGLLVRASESLGPGGDLALARLAEQAVVIDRHDLVDLPVLEALLALARSGRAARFVQVLQHTVWSLARSDVFATLPDPAPFLAAQTLLTLDLPADLAQLLLHYQAQLYSGHRREDFRLLVSELFQKTPASVEQALRALQSMENIEPPIDHTALALAYRGALLANDWSPATEPAVDRLIDMLNQRPELAAVVGYPFVADLLRHVAGRKHKTGVMRIIGPLFDRLPEETAETAPILRKVWPVLAQDPDTREAAIDLLRVHARHVPMEQAERLVRVFAGERAAEEREALIACLALRPIFDDREFLLLAEEVKIAADFFSDLLLTFELNKPPAPKRLVSEIDSLGGSLSRDEALMLAKQALALASHLEQMGDPRNRSDEAALLANKAMPRTALDFLRWLGGQFSGGERRLRRLEAEAPPHAFGNRSGPVLYREIDLIANLLGSLLRAFPPGNPPKLTLGAMQAEIQSRWKRLRLYEQRQLQGTLAQDSQTLAAFISRIAETGGSKSFLGADVAEQVEAGKVPPRSVIDALRWVSGFYAGRHRR